MPGRQNLGAQLMRGDQQVVEFDRHVAFHARDRRLAMNVALRKAVDDRLLEAAFVVEHVVRDADALGNASRVVDVLPCATRAFAMDRGAVVVKLQCHPDHVITLRLEQGGRHRGVDTARHGDDDTGVFRPAIKIEAVGHDATYYRWWRQRSNAS